MATLTPQQQFDSDFSALQSEMTRLQDAVHLNDMRRAVEQLDADIKDMFHRIERLHAQGYAFTREVELDAEHASAGWKEIEPQIRSQIETLSAPFRRNCACWRDK
jgi:predicted  nucleic acid-binding Zn-ribbon protein